MKVAVMPTSSGEYDVQIERGNDLVSNFQVVPPPVMLAALRECDPRHVVGEAMRYLAEKSALGPSPFVSLDTWWRKDRAFASAMRARLQ
jgi:hypothetical protein